MKTLTLTVMLGLTALCGTVAVKVQAPDSERKGASRLKTTIQNDYYTQSI